MADLHNALCRCCFARQYRVQIAFGNCISAEADAGCVALCVHVDEKDALAHSGELCAEVDGHGRLADSTLLICYTNCVHENLFL